MILKVTQELLLSVQSISNAINDASPSVSWLLCAHQDSELLHRAVRSCLNQTHEDFELLLIVNGQQATTLVPKLMKSYGGDARVRVIGTHVHLLNFSLSLGLHLARAPFVARMDADDVSVPHRLARQLDFMKQNPSVAVLGSAYELIDAKGQVAGKVNPPVDDRAIRRQMRYRNPICHPSVMLRRQPILELGGYLGGRNAEDYDLWLRLSLDPNWEFANLSDVLVSYNAAPEGAARRSRQAYANVAAAQVRNFLVTCDIRWLLGATFSFAKSFIRANRD